MSIDKVETEYWTQDKNGHGFCSTTTLADAIIGHLWEQKNCTDPHGPLVNVKIVRRKTVITEEVINLSELDMYGGYNF